MNPLPLFLIIVSLPLLFGSVCNAELRTWTAVNGKEVEAEFVSNEKGIVKLKLKSGKVFEVPANKLSKEDNEFISSFAKPEKVNPKPDGINVEKLEEREGIIYLKGSDTPYTGKAFILEENGNMMSEENFKNGKPEGLQLRWHANGQKKSEVNYKDGKEDGLAVGWYEGGQKQGAVTYKDGKYDGLMRLLYKNGQKKSEVNYKDGKEDGLAVAWYENGKKQGEANFKNGKQDGLAVMWHKNGQKMNEGTYKDGEIVSEKYWNSKGEPVDSREEALKE